MMTLGKMEKITDLRGLWPHEARDSSAWLARDENLALLSEALGIDVALEERESSVGGFSVDLYAVEEGIGRKIIIENQLEDTNHDHLGKLLTYAAGKEAKCMLWIVKTAREEHRAAIEYLNNNTIDGIGFFLIEIQLWSIDGSAPAVKFNVVEEPNDWAKAAKLPSNSSGGEAVQIKYSYWSDFNDYVNAHRIDYLKQFTLHKPSSDHWYSVAIGSSAANLSMLVNTRTNVIAIELYIRDSKELYDRCYAHRDEIEASVGEKLDWRRLDGKKSSRVLVERKAIVADTTTRQEQFDWLIDHLIRMKEAFTPYIK